MIAFAAAAAAASVGHKEPLKLPAEKQLELLVVLVVAAEDDRSQPELIDVSHYQLQPEDDYHPGSHDVQQHW